MTLNNNCLTTIRQVDLTVQFWFKLGISIEWLYMLRHFENAIGYLKGSLYSIFTTPLAPK